MIDENVIKMAIAITTFISLAVSIIEKIFISNSFFQKKDLQFLKIIDSSIANKISNEFKNYFAERDIDDYYFYLRTGIETNEKEKYIELKNKLKKNFSWWKIKKADNFIQSDTNDKLYIKIPIASNIAYYIINICTIILLIFCFYFSIILQINNYNKNDSIAITITMILCVLIMMCLTYLNTPIRIAKNIENRLSKIDSQTKTES